MVGKDLAELDVLKIDFGQPGSSSALRANGENVYHIVGAGTLIYPNTKNERGWVGIEKVPKGRKNIPTREAVA
jgi:hypothetical protein